MIPLLLAAALNAHAGTVFLNGTPVDGLAGVVLEDVKVEFDSEGNVFIIAPQYNVAVGDDAQAMRSRADVTAPPAPPGDSDLAPSTWWLVSEDNASTGHAVDVVINGLVVRTVRSGDKQLIFDIGPYMKTGANQVDFRVHDDASPGGGAFFLYVGTGSVDAGRVALDRPKVEFKRNSASAPGGMTQRKSLNID
jgi:hypothetical protein